MVEKIVKENLYSKAYTIIKKMISNYHFLPGERINVEKLAKELEISRTPVWEAIRRLEQEGLVSSAPNKQGVYMHTLNREEALDLIAVREKLESMVAQLSAKFIDVHTISTLQTMLDTQKHIVEHGDMGEYSQADTGFHNLIYKSTGNVYLCELLENIHSKLRPVAFHAKEFMPIFYREHVEIIDALEKHNPELAEEKFMNHTQTIMGIIRSGKMTFISSVQSKDKR